MVVGLAISRVRVQIGMISRNGIALFPSLRHLCCRNVCSDKTSDVPSVVRNASDLVEANSKLGRIATLTGAFAVVPAAGIQQLLGTGATLFYGAVFFVAAAVLATRLPQAHANRSASEPLTERGVKSSMCMSDGSQ